MKTTTNKSIYLDFRPLEDSDIVEAIKEFVGNILFYKNVIKLDHIKMQQHQALLVTDYFEKLNGLKTTDTKCKKNDSIYGVPVIILPLPLCFDKYRTVNHN